MPRRRNRKLRGLQIRLNAEAVVYLTILRVFLLGHSDLGRRHPKKHVGYGLRAKTDLS
jgi:hypothetical protein